MVGENNISKKLKKRLTKTDIVKGDEFGGVFLSCNTIKDPPSFNGRYHNFEIVTFIDYSAFQPFEKEKDYHSEAYKAFTDYTFVNVINGFSFYLELYTLQSNQNQNTPWQLKTQY